MSTDNSPSPELWRRLYAVTNKFFDLAPWQWMSDADIFGVRDPKTGVVNYCCIMGQAGEHFALAVYLGEEGLKGYLQVFTGAIREDNPDALHVQKCLMASFGDKDNLIQEDRFIIKQLGLKFRGQNSWPLFRDYTPGFLPWLINDSQASLLETTIQQAGEVALRFQKNHALLSAPDEHAFLVRALNKQGIWIDEWVMPKIDNYEPDVARETADGANDLSRLDKIKKSTGPYNGVLEIDYFYSPMPIDDGKSRPYFPRTMLCVDSDSFFILGVHMFEQGERPEKIREEIINIIEKNAMVPKIIAVKRDDLFALLHPLAVRLGIVIELREKLPAIADAKRSMSEFFRQ